MQSASSKFYILFVFSTFLLFISCLKDLEHSGKEPIALTIQESNFFSSDFFFSQNQYLRQSILPRDGESEIWVDSLVGYLIGLNQQQPFVSSLIDSLGYPVWNYSEVIEGDEGGTLILTPFAHLQDSVVSGLMYTFFGDDEWSFLILTDIEIDAIVLSDTLEENDRFSVVAQIVFDHRLFNHYDSLRIEYSNSFIAPPDSLISEDQIRNRCTDGSYYTTWCVPKPEPIAFHSDPVILTRSCGPNENEIWISYHVICGGGSGSSSVPSSTSAGGSNASPPGSPGGGSGPGNDPVENLVRLCEEINSGDPNDIDPNAPPVTPQQIQDCADLGIIHSTSLILQDNQTLGWFLAHGITLRDIATLARHGAEADLDFALARYIRDFGRVELSFAEYMVRLMKMGMIKSSGVVLTEFEEDWLLLNPENIDLSLILIGMGADADYCIDIASQNLGVTLQDFILTYDDFQLWDPQQGTPNEPEELQNGIDILLTYVPFENNEPSGTPLAFIPNRHESDFDNYESGWEDLEGELDGDDSNILLHNTTTEEILWEYMEDLFNFFTPDNSGLEEIGHSFIERFGEDSNADYFNWDLCSTLLSHNTLKNSLKKFGAALNNSLKIHDGDITGLYLTLNQSVRPVFNTWFDKWHGYQILINDTERTDIETLSFTYDPISKEWEGLFYIEITDHFGLDKLDALTYQERIPFGIGFASWWRLQHKKDYEGFKNKLRFVTKLKGKLD